MPCMMVDPSDTDDIYHVSSKTNYMITVHGQGCNH